MPERFLFASGMYVHRLHHGLHKARLRRIVPCVDTTSASQVSSVNSVNQTYVRKQHIDTYVCTCVCMCTYVCIHVYCMCVHVCGYVYVTYNENGDRQCIHYNNKKCTYTYVYMYVYVQDQSITLLYGGLLYHQIDIRAMKQLQKL